MSLQQSQQLELAELRDVGHATSQATPNVLEQETLPKSACSDFVDPFPSFWRRAAANLIDGCIIWGFCSAAGVFEGTEPFLSLVFWIAISAAYFIISERQSGQTVGKWLMGFKVICHSPALRYFSKALSALPLGAGFWMMFFDGRRRCLHDVIADAILIRV